MDNRKKRTFILVFLTIAIFSLSYYICISKLKAVHMKNNRYGINRTKEGDNSSLATNSNNDTIVSRNSTMVFKTQYNKSGEIIIDKEEPVGNLAGKKKSDVDEIYKDDGYIVQNISSSQVVLIKKVDRYAPNKYVLGIKDGHIAIYRTDKDGNMFIENENSDITDIKVDKLKQADIQLLSKGDKYFQCNTREDAEARLEDYE
jgi:predicted alpha/beta hydrolase family esterase